MTDYEILKAILDEVKGFNTRFDKLEAEFGNLKTEIDTEIDSLKTEVGKVNSRLDKVEAEIGKVNTRLDKVDAEVRQNTVAIETTVDKCLQAYGDGYIAVREQLHDINVDKINDTLMMHDLRLTVLENDRKNEVQAKIS